MVHGRVAVGVEDQTAGRNHGTLANRFCSAADFGTATGFVRTWNLDLDRCFNSFVAGFSFSLIFRKTNLCSAETIEK